MQNCEDLKFHHEHAWAKVDGYKAIMGISDFAQDQLGEVVYIDLPEPGTSIVKAAEICEIESTKVVSSFIAPLSGTILEVNENLRDAADIINNSPYEDGWIVVVELTDLSEVSDLMSETEYKALVAGK